MRSHRLIALAALVFIAGACGSSDETTADSSDMDSSAAGTSTSSSAEPSSTSPAATVTILSPNAETEVEGSAVTVVLDVAGIRIVPAGDMTERTGHHHLFLDADLTDPTQPVPTVPGSIIHMGDGSDEYVFEGVSPGQHRLIAVVADGAHVPLQPWLVDTVTFTVR